jgi:hypothetical protein
MNTGEARAKVTGLVWSFGVTGSDAQAELVFVLETPQGRVDFKTEDSADPRSFAAMSSVLAAAYIRQEPVFVTFCESTRLVNFVGLPAVRW